MDKELVMTDCVKQGELEEVEKLENREEVLESNHGQVV